MTELGGKSNDRRAGTCAFDAGRARFFRRGGSDGIGAGTAQ
jgi:hypothetical protein